MTELQKMLAKLGALKTAAQEALDTNDVETAKAKMAEAKALKEKIELQEQLDNEMEHELTDRAKSMEPVTTAATKDNANAIRAIIKKMTHRKLTDAEKTLLLPTAEDPDGENGEAYILPQDISTKINKRIRDFKSFRNVIGMIKTTALTGSLPVEDVSGVTGLLDLTDGQNIGDSEDPKFVAVRWALKKKGAIITMSNTLLQMTDNDLEEYVIDYFAKKAVITENNMAVAALKSNKTVITITGWAHLKSLINTKLDPASLYGTVIVTNQDGFDIFDRAVDENGRPILQPNPSDPTKKVMFGYPVEVFSRKMLPGSEATATEDGYVPVFFGNLESGAKFVLNKDIQFATSKEAGFRTDTTLARVIELIDCVQYDGSDECYVYGQLKVADKMTTSDPEPDPEPDPEESTEQPAG